MLQCTVFKQRKLMGISAWKRTCSLCFMLLIMLQPAKDQLVSAASTIYSYNECNAASTTGSVLAECSVDEELGTMESDHIRVRLEAAGKYITPGVLKSDIPFCNKASPGEPYHKGCIPPPSNPYNRGCSNIYRCRGR